MLRCNKTSDLDVYHINIANDNTLGNAVVLCWECYGKRHKYRSSGFILPEFSQVVKELALMKAGHRCECINDDCH